jgi:hypothetical protein
MTLSRIRLELARDSEFPEGSRHHGYDLVAPLLDDGHIDAAAWRKQRDKCRVVRFWGDEPNEVGHLVHKPGGAWAFHYDVDGDADDDETGFKLDRHRFRPGEYVSVREHDGDLRTFRVVAVRPL